MATVVETSPLTRREQPVVLCIVVAVAVVVGWVLYRHYVFPHASQRVFGWQALGRWLWLAELVPALLLSVPYALALLLWGRDLTRGVAGAGVAIGAGVYVAALSYGFEKYVFGPTGAGFDPTSLRAYDWSMLIGQSVLVPLAWGVARRHGRAWVAGLVVGPVVAAILHEMQLHWRWWQVHVTFGQHTGAWVLVAAVYVAPFVAAALACWALDSRDPRPATQ